MATFGEGIYLLKLREFVNSNKNIYKIGRSANLCRRVKNYPNGSMLYLMIECDESTTHERKLIELFTEKYKLESNYGNEYFSGKLQDMKNDIVKYIENVMINKDCRKVVKDIIIDKKTKIGNSNKSVFQEQLDELFNIVIEKDIVIKEENLIKMPDRLCVCGKQFKYPYLLVRHLNSMKCNLLITVPHTLPESVYKNKDNKKENEDNKKYNCSKCQRKFAKKFNMVRHQNTCSVNNNVDNNVDNNVENNVNNNTIALKQIIEEKDKQLAESNKDRRYYIDLYIQNLKDTYEKKIEELQKNISMPRNWQFNNLQEFLNKDNNDSETNIINKNNEVNTLSGNVINNKTGKLSNTSKSIKPYISIFDIEDL